MNDRSTELVHTVDCGQVSVNISKPGITKGQHWHNSKWEQFIVVHGHGLIEERNINTGEKVSFEVSGDKLEAVYMIPGWTHNNILQSFSLLIRPAEPEADWGYHLVKVYRVHIL